MTAQPTGSKLPTYVTLEQAAQITEQSVKTIRRRIADGTLPGYRFGGRNIRIRLDELEAAARLIPTVRTWKGHSGARPSSASG